MSPAYYNEIDPYAAQWCRNLIVAGLIAAGDVDERSIVDVRADDLLGYDQCHFFAGIGGWSVALRLAGWADERAVWTGSCPCQPFSLAGARQGQADKRHLWPAWSPLIAQRRPAIIFGEQVAAAIKWGWLDDVFADLEREDYACGSAVLPACGVGAPHLRQRCWFVANAAVAGWREGQERPAATHGWPAAQSRRLRDAGGVADAAVARRQGGAHGRQALHPQLASAERSGGDDGAVADAARGGLGEFGDAARPGRGRHLDGGDLFGALADPERDGGRADQPQRQAQRRIADGWAGAQLIACSDGKARPVEPGSFPLAHGVQRRTSKLRAYGNAIVPQIAAEFILAAAP